MQRLFKVLPAPRPDDVNWPALQRSWWQRTVRGRGCRVRAHYHHLPAARLAPSAAAPAVRAALLPTPPTPCSFTSRTPCPPSSQMRPLYALPIILFFMLLPIGMFTGAFAQLTVALCGSPADPGSRSDNWCGRAWAVGRDGGRCGIGGRRQGLWAWQQRAVPATPTSAAPSQTTPHPPAHTRAHPAPPAPCQVLLGRPLGHVPAQCHHLARALTGAVHLPHVRVCVRVCVPALGSSSSLGRAQ